MVHVALSTRPSVNGVVLLVHREHRDWLLKVNIGGPGQPVGVAVLPHVEVDREAIDEFRDLDDWLAWALTSAWVDAKPLTARRLRDLTNGLETAAMTEVTEFARHLRDDHMAEAVASGEATEAWDRLTEPWREAGLDLPGEAPAVRELETISEWLSDAPSPSRRPRAGQRSLRELAEIARLYAVTDRPDRVRVLADQLALAPSTLSNLILEIRNEHKLLTPTQQGKAGGQLTPKAWRILNGED